MSNTKVVKWMNDNMTLVAGISLIISVHYGWWQLQKNPTLVDQSKRKQDMPIVGAIKTFKNKLQEKYGSGVAATATVAESQEK